jgi:hypothetical protein
VEEVSPWVEAVLKLWDDPAEYGLAATAARGASSAWYPDEVVPRWETFFQGLHSRR